jgi:hypothetical protein
VLTEKFLVQLALEAFVAYQGSVPAVQTPSAALSTVSNGLTRIQSTTYLKIAIETLSSGKYSSNQVIER